MKNIKMNTDWCLTINNYTYDDVRAFAHYEHELSYFVIGFEECPTTKTPHLQCFIVANEPVSFGIIKKAFKRAHIEALRTTREAAILYCKKTGFFAEKDFLHVRKKNT